MQFVISVSGFRVCWNNSSYITKTNKDISRFYWHQLFIDPMVCKEVQLGTLTKMNLFTAIILCFPMKAVHYFSKKLHFIYLTHSLPMHLFSTPWKHQKTVRFSVFRGVEKRALGTNGLTGFWKRFGIFYRYFTEK